MADRLADATSPYLLQHAANPVDWWPWSDAAFEAAARRDVPVLLSVGYSACHWCHVMAHESFEDEQTAALMNEHLVAIKVDREERPDVDAIYMSATQAMTGQGGWPMTVFLTPGREPFYCGTYFPRPQFQRLVLGVAKAWRDDRAGVADQARQIAAALAEQSGATGAYLTGDGAATAYLAAGGGAADEARPRPPAWRPPRRPRWARWAGSTTRPAAASAERRSSRRRWSWSSCSGTPSAPATAAGTAPRPAPVTRRWPWPRGRPPRWRGAGCMTSWRGASPGTAPTRTGSCRTSRRCSTTTRCWPACTPTCGG